MRIDSSDVKEGARRIISKNLGLRLEEDVVILVDEVTIRVGQALVAGARFDGVRPTLIVVSRDDQPAYTNSYILPLALARAIESTQAVIISTSDWPEGTGFRRCILELTRQQKTKVALMPGVTLEMVAELGHLDYSLLLTYSDALQMPLLLGRKAVITTWDKDGISRELNMDLGAWSQPPTISTGIIHQQSFDNIPSGEIYIAPLKGSANGELVVNGSITDYVFSDGDEILLIIRNGVLSEILPKNHPAADFLFKAITIAHEHGDLEPDFICELGIGVVPGVNRLSGNTLRDEKAYRTAHIAIGLNEPFGGDVDAHTIHEDMIFHRPSITIDGKTIICRGEICVREQDWSISHRNVVVIPPYALERIALQSSGNQVEIGTGGILYRVYFDGTDTLALARVGDNETASIAAKVYSQIPENGVVSLEKIANKTNLPLETVRAVAWIMGEIFALVEVVIPD